MNQQKNIFVFEFWVWILILWFFYLATIWCIQHRQPQTQTSGDSFFAHPPTTGPRLYVTSRTSYQYHHHIMVWGGGRMDFFAFLHLFPTHTGRADCPAWTGGNPVSIPQQTQQCLLGSWYWIATSPSWAVRAPSVLPPVRGYLWDSLG